jgi:hypothetical protein
VSCPEALAELETLPTTVTDDDEPRSRDWIESIEGRTNLPAGVSATQALECVGPQGLDGCGFEAPLESMWKALDRMATAGDPAFGFMRPTAILSVVHVTDGTDCSFNPDWEAIFLPESDRVFWSDPEAEAPTAAVCWNAGVVCDGETSPYESCRAANLDIEGNEVESNAEERAVLHPVRRYVDRLRDLETDKQTITPDQEVLVSIIAGVGSDGRVVYEDALDDPAFQQDFGIGPGCEGADGPAVPPVRLLELAEVFQVGDQQNVFSACDDDYSPALTAIAEAIAEQIKPACFPACAADIDPSTPDVLDTSCRLVQESPRGDGSFEEINMPACEPDRSVPDGFDACYLELKGDDRSDLCMEYGFNLEFEIVRRDGVALPPGTSINPVCNLSQDKETDCPELP